MDRRMFLYFLGILLLLSALCACQAAGTAPLPTPTTEPTNTALPIATDTRSPTITPTNTPTPDAVATKQAEQAEFEAKKAEALKMVSIKLNSSEDLANLPVNDARDFDNHNIQDEIHWLINNDKNDLPPADDVKLPDTWRIARNNDTGFYWMSYDMLAEARVKTYRSVAAFFVMQDGKMMLRIGVEYGGKDKLVFINSPYAE
jgi:hypothetical protein